MNELLNIISVVFRVVFIISSIMFGFGIAFRIFLIKTLKNVTLESEKNFDKIEDIAKKSKSREIIENAKKEYSSHLEKVEEYKKKSKRLKLQKALNIDNEQTLIAPPESYEFFINLFKNSAVVYTGDKSYLSFSFAEIIEVLNSILDRFKTILDGTKFIWLKSINVSIVLYALSAIKEYEKFKSKRLVFIALFFLDACMSISKFFSPIGAGNQLLTKLLDGNISNLVSNAIIEVLVMEISCLYNAKELDEPSKTQKSA